MSNNKHPLTVRITHEMWLKLRRLQEERKIKSIQDAITKGLKMVIEKR